jgi:hypothetical protein
MAKFCFYYGADHNLLEKLRRAAVFCWGSVEESAHGSFRLFVATEDYEQSFCRTENLIGAVSGYVHNFGEQNPAGDVETNRRRHNERFLAEISKNSWPLDDDWTGNFAAAVYSPSKGEITLCNDIIGHLPLYYTQIDKGFAGGTSLIILSRTLECRTDAIGVLQRITVPFCNYGRRTLLKNVSRLLPGERLQWVQQGAVVNREYDNSLCSELIDSDVGKAARRVWDCLQNEITTVTGDGKHFAVAMSGGWDSRLVLGGVRQSGSLVTCLTYGGEDHYETRIARRCAEAIGASHECFPIDDHYFPARREIETLIKETESGNYFEWFGIIEKARSNGIKVPLLLGDLCESIDGRYMTQFSTRKARINSFLSGLAGAAESFPPADAAVFESWRDNKRNEITNALLANLPQLSADLSDSLTKEQAVRKIQADLELSFARVRDNKPHFAAMYDELFIWFHRIRFLLGNQITWLSAAFRPVSPGLSTRFLRLITSIHPKLRIRKRLMNGIIRLPEFDRLARIPSAQIPFLNSRAPDLIKDIFWGTRFGLDQLLIRRSLRTKNANNRQRVLRSLDYVKEYRRENSRRNVESWFSGKYIKRDDYLRIFRERAALNAWTLINVDIAAPANVSIILDLCRAEAETETAARKIKL